MTLRPNPPALTDEQRDAAVREFVQIALANDLTVTELESLLTETVARYQIEREQSA